MAKPDPKLLDDVVAPVVLEAMRLASIALSRAYLVAHATSMVTAFDDAIARATAEE